MTLAEVAAYLRVHWSTVYQWVKCRGQVPDGLGLALQRPARREVAQATRKGHDIGRTRSGLQARLMKNRARRSRRPHMLVAILLVPVLIATILILLTLLGVIPLRP